MAAPRVSFGEKDMENGTDAERYVLRSSPRARAACIGSLITFSSMLRTQLQLVIDWRLTDHADRARANGLKLQATLKI